jgi:hypothetical protein
VPALQFDIGNCRLLFGFVGRGVEEGEGVRGFVKGCARLVDVAAGGDLSSRKGREVEKRRGIEDRGMREDARRRQRVQIMLLVRLDLDGV